MQNLATSPDYECLDGAVPVLYPPDAEDQAQELGILLQIGVRELSALLEVEPPGLRAYLVPDKDWHDAPRESGAPYPVGLPYFTRSATPPALVIPEELSPVFQPRTESLLPLILWHELAHAFLLQRDVVLTPSWLREFLPQAAAVAVARRSGIPLEKHLSRIEKPGFAVRKSGKRMNAGEQMALQNLLLLFGYATLEEFGDGFLGRLARALWNKQEIVDEGRAEELLAGSLGAGGQQWLESRPEF